MESTVRNSREKVAVGANWVVPQPVLTMLAFTSFVGRIADHPSQDLPYTDFYFRPRSWLEAQIVN
jgi:hypothetical protein